MLYNNLRSYLNRNIIYEKCVPYQCKYELHDLKRKVMLPEKSERLAELFGILSGDDYIEIYKSNTGIQYFRKRKD